VLIICFRGNGVLLLLFVCRYRCLLFVVYSVVNVACETRSGTTGREEKTRR
jgi:hypothetical protein